MLLSSKSKLTLWLQTEAKQFGKRWAKNHHASLSQVVSDYLTRLQETEEKSLKLTPIVRRLTGMLKGEGKDLGDHRKHIEKKYLGD